MFLAKERSGKDDECEDVDPVMDTIEEIHLSSKNIVFCMFDCKMPLTNAERQTKYREKLRTQNPSKYEEIKSKNAEKIKKDRKPRNLRKKIKD
ncbi:hypothetical protein evm_012319 [Chilo suppressalis]|nr:hypothetical protein evm_012319 [Chilo suppressalis]